VDPIRDVFQFSSGSLPAIVMPLTTIGDVSVTEQTYGRRNAKVVRHRVQLASGAGGAALALGEYDNVRDAQALIGSGNKYVTVLPPAEMQISTSRPRKLEGSSLLPPRSIAISLLAPLPWSNRFPRSLPEKC